MKQPTRGKLIERRNGLEGFAWEGIATKVDPAGSPSNRPRDLVNTRVQGGVIISRPGFQGEGGHIPLIPIYDVETPDATERPAYEVIDVVRADPHWLADHNWSAGVKLWAASRTSGNVASLGFIDIDADEAFQTVASISLPSSVDALWIEKFNNEFYFGEYGALRKLYLVPSREGDNSPPVDSTLLSDEIIISYPDSITAFITEHDGKLIFGATGGAAGQFYSWDGLVVTPELTLASPGPTVCPVASYKDTVVVAVRDDVAPGQGSLYVRDATGAWTSFTLVGFNPTLYPNSIAEYGNLLYIVDGANNIFTWDGTAITLAHTVALSTSLNVCARHAGRLYFAYIYDNTRIELAYADQDNAPAGTFRDIATRTGVNALAIPPEGMAEYRGRLWIAAVNSGDTKLYWHSQQFTPFDGWQTTATAEAFTPFNASFGSITNLRVL